MSVLLDTAVLAEIMKPATEGFRWARRWLLRQPISVSSISVFELAFGFQQATVDALRRGDERRARDWRVRAGEFAALIRQECFSVCAYTLDAALVAAYLYARAPAPSPAVWRRSRGRAKSKTAIRRSWLLDVKIASIAVAHGLAVLTANAQDFRQLSSLLPPEWPLQVLRFPEEAPEAST